MSAKSNLSLVISVAVISSLSTTACNPVKDTGNAFNDTFNSDDPCSNNARNIGILAGGVLGAVLGNQMGDGKGAVLGAALGAGLGAWIGSDIDSRRCELHKISQRYKVPIQAEPIKAVDAGMTSESLGSQSKTASSDVVGLKVNLQDTGKQFASGSDQLTSEARSYFGEIARTYTGSSISTKDPKQRREQEALLAQKKILIVGHTDDTGGSQFNADLAERRAKVVAELFAEYGVARENLHFQGAGETQPIADNRTEQGRAKNRRAEIIELPNQQALETYLAHRKPVIAFYRNDQSTAFVKPKLNKPLTPPAIAKAKTKTKQQPTVTPENSASESPQTPLTVLTAATEKSSIWHFDGKPLSMQSASVSIGEVIPEKDKLAWIPFIGSAHADEKKMDSVYSATCSADRPRSSRGVKSLASGKEIALNTNDYLPGLYNTVWMGNAGGHKVALSNVAVARDGAIPVKNPTVRFYSDVNTTQDSQPLATPTTQVNAYRGKEGVLYRVFIMDNNLPVSCMDIVMPNQAPFNAKAGYLIYQDQNQDYATTFKPSKI